mgnify:CR=1 FL=1
MAREIEVIPFASNDLTADYLFEQRKYYVSSSDVYPREDRSRNDLPKPVDMWYNKPYWGKVDTRQRLIIPDSDSLLSFNTDFSAINFVAEAYLGFRSYAIDAARKLRTSMTSFIDIQNPVGAYENSVEAYKNYFENTLEPGFVNDFLSDIDRANINNFRDYAREYETFVQVNFDIPHTLAGYICSPLTSYRHSGMIIEFANDPYHDDANKWNKFLSNDFFPDYVKIASYFGFYVSKHVPWAIAANINSKYMKNYMRKYGINNAVQFFNLNYLQAEYISYESFKKYMFLAYASFITNSPRKEVTIYKNCIKKTLSDSSFKTERNIVFRPIEINFYFPDFDDFTAIYSDAFFLKLYTKIRLKEEKIKLTQRGYDLLMLKIFNADGDIFDRTLILSDYLASKRKNKFNKLTMEPKPDIMNEQKAPLSSYFNMGDTQTVIIPAAGGSGGASTTGY